MYNLQKTHTHTVTFIYIGRFLPEILNICQRGINKSLEFVFHPQTVRDIGLPALNLTPKSNCKPS